MLDLSQTNQQPAGISAEIPKAVRSFSGLTQKLLGFGQKQLIKPKIFDLNRGLVFLRSIILELLEAKVSFELLPATSVALIKMIKAS